MRTGICTSSVRYRPPSAFVRPTIPPAQGHACKARPCPFAIPRRWTSRAHPNGRFRVSSGGLRGSPSARTCRLRGSLVFPPCGLTPTATRRRPEERPNAIPPLLQDAATNPLPAETIRSVGRTPRRWRRVPRRGRLCGARRFPPSTGSADTVRPAFPRGAAPRFPWSPPGPAAGGTKACRRCRTRSTRCLRSRKRDSIAFARPRKVTVESPRRPTPFSRILDNGVAKTLSAGNEDQQSFETMCERSVRLASLFRKIVQGNAGCE